MVGIRLIISCVVESLVVITAVVAVDMLGSPTIGLND